jgi:hypothetical protein
MTISLRRLIVLAILTAGCDTGRPAPFVLPGPAVPSPIPIVSPYVWDTRDELAIWMNNRVSRGSFALEGSGSEAFIRVDRADREWVLRGPDLNPAADGIRTVSIRYRWRPDPGLPPTSSLTARVSAYFQTTTPVVAHDPTEQAHMSSNLQPRADWADIALLPQGQFKPPIGVTYCYLHSFDADRGVLDIDRIELVR